MIHLTKEALSKNFLEEIIMKKRLLILAAGIVFISISACSDHHSHDDDSHSHDDAPTHHESIDTPSN